MRYAQIINNAIHWICETAETPFDEFRLLYSPDINFIDITNINPEPEEGWIFDGHSFAAPPVSYPVSLVEYKQIKLEEINNACKAEIIAGMVSDALGEMHRYDTDIEDQLNFQQAMSMAQVNYQNWQAAHSLWQAKITADSTCTDPEPTEAPVMYRIWNTDGVTKDWYPHYYKTFTQVLTDGAEYKERLLYICSQLKSAVMAVTSYEEVDNINWIPIGMQPIEPK